MCFNTSENMSLDFKLNSLLMFIFIDLSFKINSMISKLNYVPSLQLNDRNYTHDFLLFRMKYSTRCCVKNYY